MAEELPTLTMSFGCWADVVAQRQHLERGCLFLPLPEPEPAPLSRLAIWLRPPAGDALQLAARVVQLVPAVGMALAIEELERSREQLDDLLHTADSHHDETVGESSCCWGEPTPAAAEATPQEAGSLHDRIRQMSTAEKRRLALGGDRTARQLLLKDPNKALHLFVLKNRGITLDEVRYMAGYRQTSPDVLQHIAASREWLRNPRVVAALVTNPKTPTNVATRLLSKLPAAELRRIAKSNHVPRAVAMAARKLVVG